MPILKADPRLDGVKVTSWVSDIDYRPFPMLMIRRIGGARNKDAPMVHGTYVIELTAYTDAKTSGSQGIIDCERLYETALDVLYDAVKNQTPTDAGYLQSMFETMGATQFSSPYQDSWRIQGLIRLCVRGPRTNS